MKKYYGFTLVELIIVITILAILATVAFASFQNYTSQTRDTKRLSDLSQITKGLEVYSVGVGNFPIPYNSKILTGGLNILNVGKINSKVLSNLKGNILDPVSGVEYSYATLNNGKYYQIGADIENVTSGLFQNTYADLKTTKVIGNYYFDPSLPSLIISSGSNLYDPNNCFVINGGTNLVSNNAGCNSKLNTTLKSFDSSLVAYWDMESLSGGKLKDLSGNGKDGTFVGTIVPSSTGGYVGSALNFKSGAIAQTDYTYFKNVFYDEYTISMIVRNDNYNIMSKIISNSEAGGIAMSFNLSIQTVVNCSLNGSINTFCLISGVSGTGAYETSPIDYTSIKNKNDFSMITYVYNNKNTKLYIDGLLVNETTQKNHIYYNNNSYLCLGSEAYLLNCNQEYFNGVIDEVKIYNRALSSEEILQSAKITGFIK